jgi:hypothetical protein
MAKYLVFWHSAEVSTLSPHGLIEDQAETFGKQNNDPSTGPIPPNLATSAGHGRLRFHNLISQDRAH